mmetsp:Transcript_5377/g.15896  ORF Transcript_5377/g.15896 Transcript_5377/m.15896 type:complete len:207 (+) Transcript_5377:396-1016(+)
MGPSDSSSTSSARPAGRDRLVLASLLDALCRFFTFACSSSLSLPAPSCFLRLACFPSFSSLFCFFFFFSSLSLSFRSFLAFFFISFASSFAFSGLISSAAALTSANFSLSWPCMVPPSTERIAMALSIGSSNCTVFSAKPHSSTKPSASRKDNTRPLTKYCCCILHTCAGPRSLNSQSANLSPFSSSSTRSFSTSPKVVQILLTIS